ncbi:MULTISPECIES: metalloregulator ArsR/SmtB family transcription factor [Paraburkholderia]|uniref:Transcriptional regulator n=1 Tax=Paraburkholderia madseniana TaxID=2599607 RepID=A0AAP5B717_9BURK|nr:MULTISPECIES: metalloregulator ArsR/SmtB family transcription factor [Paraburkholderia]MCX4144064.1 transcriptional regulator [Paraburkholderia madseniana]MDN7147018.1 transcriptional regulator [Paraburkholderia sp. WS6]MDQ6405898.1 transcriptional regulator [Paraburkholderia madseniana]
MENSPAVTQAASAAAPVDRVLNLLKTQGSLSTASIAGELGITVEAARQQIQKLLTSGLIEGRQASQAGPGRPSQSWGLTEAGNARFPDTHPQLTVQLLGSIRQLFGEEGLDKLIDQRAVETRANYLAALKPIKGLKARLTRLAEIRSAEGYMAELQKDGRDWLLLENHCPICAAARTCQGFCRAELQLFAEIVGEEGSIEREEHVLAGARRCAYRVKPKSK